MRCKFLKNHLLSLSNDPPPLTRHYLEIFKTLRQNNQVSGSSDVGVDCGVQHAIGVIVGRGSCR